jgi:excinuclease ABC subunit C
MREIITRRYGRTLTESEDLPDLILIDGGKGQLSAALTALTALGLADKIAIISIAKRLEEIYCPEDPYPLHLDKKGTTLPILQQLRDEAHRFGIGHHRKKRSKAALFSELEQIKGIGASSIQLLITHLLTVESIKKASEAELAEILKNIARAKKVWNYFH